MPHCIKCNSILDDFEIETCNECEGDDYCLCGNELLTDIEKESGFCRECI